MSDWTTDAADAIDRTVGLLRDRTVEPATVVARAIVYGLIAALIGVPAAVMLLIAVFRLLVIAEQQYVWASWCTLGGILLLAGLLLWSKRYP